MTTAVALTSPEFPAGYGDFKLISSDDVVFHFPRFLLSHVSPVFRDMFGVANSSSEPPELKITEESTTINRLLRFFDPNKKILPIDYSDQTATVRLFEAARKYQVDQVFDWWEKEIQVESVSKGWKELDNPMQVLALVSRYHLPQVARVALRQLISAPSSEMQSSISFESGLFYHLIQLREQRVRWYVDQLKAWLKLPRPGLHPLRNFYKCANCKAIQVEECILHLVALLSAHPSHRILQYKSRNKTCICLDPETDQTGFAIYLRTTLVPAAQDLEKEVPQLPPDYC